MTVADKVINENKILPIFARHETFHVRHGWLKKGFDKAKEDPKLFLSDDATVVLGVGKNMVKAIKYWCLVFNILDEPRENNKSLGLYPTDFGEQLFSDSGWDPFLENDASLWLLHWQIFKSPCWAPAWYYTYNSFKKVDFTKDILTNGLLEYKENNFPNSNAVQSSLEKDINCILRMYTKQNNKITGEDSIDCPFTELNLINNTTDSKHYAFNVGSKFNLPEEIIVACCLEYAHINDCENNSKTISVSRLLYEEGSPGLIFKLTESSIHDALDKVCGKFNNIYLSDTAGLVQLCFDENPQILSERILEEYYRR